ncbi:unnamed protein product [Prorocentrum cordatum]|uniref:Uncharacterized protein n=1 Tax=Prorocentrum cordatum TaxID=2364126 RepID=A0ABN9XE00_9DINO|nr:unnamed protein product [Polarella glacialis]
MIAGRGSHKGRRPQGQEEGRQGLRRWRSQLRGPARGAARGAEGSAGELRRGPRVAAGDAGHHLRPREDEIPPRARRGPGAHLSVLRPGQGPMPQHLQAGGPGGCHRREGGPAGPPEAAKAASEWPTEWPTPEGAREAALGAEGVAYSALVGESRAPPGLLRARLRASGGIPAGWTTYCEHMTICMGPLQRPRTEDNRSCAEAVRRQTAALSVEQEMDLRVVSIGELPDSVLAVGVVGCPSCNKNPHIRRHVTVAVAPKKRPQLSNDIRRWTVLPAEEQVELHGAVWQRGAGRDHVPPGPAWQRGARGGGRGGGRGAGGARGGGAGSGGEVGVASGDRGSTQRGIVETWR